MIRPEDWPRVKAVFEGALTYGGADRLAYVDRACGDDSVLRGEIEQLLASHDRAHTFLEAPASDLLDVRSRPDVMIGARVGSYQIGSRIGAGGMARCTSLATRSWIGPWRSSFSRRMWLPTPNGCGAFATRRAPPPP